MIELKTAVLLGCCLQIGAIIADADDTESKHLYEFGKSMGIAFQLQDDLLDVYGNAEKFGKQTGGDIISNKKTFLVLKAQELSNAHQRSILNQWINTSVTGQAQQKVKEIKNLFDGLDIRKYAEQEMETQYDYAIQHLNAVNVSAEKKSILEKFASQLMVREA
jgi:geranylgeranyl diphosphate synthase type II